MGDEDSFLMGGGGTSAKFEKIGDIVRGKIISKPVLRQRTDINTGVPMTWADGRPQQQLVVQLDTGEIDPDIEDDDGVRNLYIRFKMRDAVKDAVKAAGAKGLDVGGTLAVKFVGQEKPRKRGQQGTKLYRAKYVAPDPSEYLEDGMGEEDEYEVETPPPAKKAAAKKAPARRAKAPEPEDEIEDDLDLDDEPEAAPAPRRAAKKAPAKKAAARAAVDEFSDDDEDTDEGF